MRQAFASELGGISLLSPSKKGSYAWAFQQIGSLLPQLNLSLVEVISFQPFSYLQEFVIWPAGMRIQIWMIAVSASGYLNNQISLE